MYHRIGYVEDCVARWENVVFKLSTNMPALLSDIFKRVVETPTEENLEHAQEEWEASKNALVFDREDVELFNDTILVPALSLHGLAPRGRTHHTTPWDIFDIPKPCNLAEIKDKTVPALICSLRLYIAKQKLELNGFENMRSHETITDKVYNPTIRDWRCSICQEGWKPGTELVSACRQTGRIVHGFHRACIGPWAQAGGSCPKCRGPLNLEPVKNVLAHGGGGTPGRTLTARFGGPQSNEYFVETGKFDWAKLLDVNKDLTDKILRFTGARIVRKRHLHHPLPKECLPPGMPFLEYLRSTLSKNIGTFETLVLERPRHDILTHASKMTVTFSDCVDRAWFGFAKYAEFGWPLDRNAVCDAMDFKQTFTDVIKIRLVPRHNPFLLAWHVEVVRQHPITGGEEIAVRIGKDPERDIDYLVYHEEQHGEISRRLREELHLRHRVVEGADEFSADEFSVV